MVNIERGVGRWQSLVAVLSAVGLRLRGIDQIVSARVKRGWSVSAAAERAGLTSPTIRAVERTGQGRLETLEAFARALRVRLSVTPTRAKYTEAGGAAYSKQSDEHWTPSDVVARILRALRIRRFDLDPCAPNLTNGMAQPVPARGYLTSADDGLKAAWKGSTAFVNPPYSSLRSWLERCALAADAGIRVVGLVPARIETRAWRENIVGRAVVVFLQGRIRFSGPNGLAENGAPIASAVVLWGAWSSDAASRLVALFPGAWAANTGSR